MIDTQATSRVVLVPERQSAGTPPSPVARRYRLARLKLNHRQDEAGDRFGHIRRVYD